MADTTTPGTAAIEPTSSPAGAVSAWLDALWRATTYCFLPRAFLLMLLPFVLMSVLVFGLAVAYWAEAVNAVRDALASWELLAPFFHWMDSAGLGSAKSAVGPLLVVFVATPLVVVLSLLAVALIMTPFMTRLVAQRRFPFLEMRRGGSFLGSVVLGVVTSLIACIALVVTLPLWLVPPLALILPPVIWGWLTYRLMSYDVLAEYASREERRALLRRHRVGLMSMGVIAGYLGSLPSLVWAVSPMAAVWAPWLAPGVALIYSALFAFAALWFAHYLLNALESMRREAAATGAVRADPAGAVSPGVPGDESAAV